MKILAVDDDADFLNMLRESLAHYDLELSYNYEDALSSFKTFGPDLVLLDYLMEGDKRTGLDLAIDIKKLNPTTPLILLTGILVREGYNLEKIFLRIFKKPIDGENLIDFIDKVSISP